MFVNQSITILFRGGRLPAWHRLSTDQKDAFQQEHVDLMLRIASEHNMCRLEGFRLIAPQGGWERFWIIQFPALQGAEAWIEAEMAPPYGQYGFYDYHLSRQHLPAVGSDWPSDTRIASSPFVGDPHQVPVLSVDRDSVVVFLYESGRPDAGSLLEDEKVPNAMSTTSSFVESFGVKRLERFDLISSKAKWNQVLLVELPTLDAAEAWIESKTAVDRNENVEQHFQITRKWGEGYFASWSPH